MLDRRRGEAENALMVEVDDCFWCAGVDMRLGETCSGPTVSSVGTSVDRAGDGVRLGLHR